MLIENVLYLCSKDKYIIIFRIKGKLFNVSSRLEPLSMTVSYCIYWRYVHTHIHTRTRAHTHTHTHTKRYRGARERERGEGTRERGGGERGL